LRIDKRNVNNPPTEEAAAEPQIELHEKNNALRIDKRNVNNPPTEEAAAEPQIDAQKTKRENARNPYRNPTQDATVGLLKELFRKKNLPLEAAAAKPQIELHEEELAPEIDERNAKNLPLEAAAAKPQIKLHEEEFAPEIDESIVKDPLILDAAMDVAIADPKEIFGKESPPATAQTIEDPSQIIDPFSWITKWDVKLNQQLSLKTKKISQKLNNVCSLNGQIKIFVLNVSPDTIKGIFRGNFTFLFLEAADGRIGFPCFFNTLTIFVRGQQKVCRATYLSDRNIQNALKETDLGKSGWSPSNRVGNECVISNWREAFFNGTVTFVINYNGRYFLVTPSKTKDNDLN
jgi:hypothetical protein